ncbi:MAG: type I restriction enzyme HsdR N-terminal domain-containing protein [Firmicutes bacterium]|nr:type I restriction enzyme HsdR N-terminal domain-containing protein [Bacillota bacterium]MCM1400904.1 type I restriction enzyme HsdR N-terminal domain-containing protein [Bacteroides sp.]MCM1476557.1 type I restriction enzyme HsdR N-terminal domain-containing protein [Bacteroides sp.]
MNRQDYPMLNLPPAALKLRAPESEQHRPGVYDPLRKRWVSLTPEEWVRQHFVAMLVNEKHYPAALMANEIGIKLNATSRRCDTVVFNRVKEPWMIVEYKAPDVEITQQTFDQIVRYNMVLRARYLVVSNGLSHFCCAMDYENHSYRFIPEIPEFNQLPVE